MNFPQHKIVLALPDISPDDSLALLRILAAVGLKVRGGKIAPLTAMINDNFSDAKAVVEALGVDGRMFKRLCAQLKDRGQTIDNAAAFLPVLRKAINANRFSNDTESISAAAASLLPTILTVISSPDSEGSFNTVQKNIGQLKVKELTQAYAGLTADKLGDVDEMTTALKDLGRKLTGQPVMALTPEQRQKATAKNPEVLKEFNKQVANLRIRVGAEIRNVVTSLGEKAATVKAVSEELEKRGVPNPLHPGLRKTTRILVNQDGKLTDKLGNVSTVSNAAPQYKVEINRDYDPDPSKKGKSWIFKVINPETGKVIGRGYADTTTQARKGGSFDKLLKAADSIEKYKAKWRKDLMQKGDIEDASRVYAALCELMYWTGLRVSTGEGLSAGERTYGATSFLVKHVMVGGKKAASGNVSGTSFKATFPAKSGKLYTMELNAADPHVPEEDSRYYKAMIQFLIAKTKGKKAGDIVMTVDDTESGRINASKLNAYIKSKGIPFTAKDFRTFRGTAIAMNVLPGAAETLKKLQKKNGGKPLAIAEVNRIFLEAITQVGAQLGHKRGEKIVPDTAIKYYINPALMVDWFRQAGYQPSKKVQEAAIKAGMTI